MFIVGERINTSRKSIDRAVRERDMAFIQAEADAQVKAGARMVDVNCGTFGPGEEPDLMQWLVQAIQETSDVALCIDSPNASTLEAGLAVHRGKAMVNSISLEEERYLRVLPLVKRFGASVVALCQDGNGIPSSLSAAREVARRLIGRLLDDGVPRDDIHFDPLVRSVATSPETVKETLALVHELSGEFAGVHFISGLSNVSFGLPERRHLNRAYVVMSMASGLDAVIMDPLDEIMMALIYASEALLSQDRFCLTYIRAFNNGLLKV